MAKDRTAWRNQGGGLYITGIKELTQPVAEDEHKRMREYLFMLEKVKARLWRDGYVRLCSYLGCLGETTEVAALGDNEMFYCKDHPPEIHWVMEDHLRLSTLGL